MRDAVDRLEPDQAELVRLLHWDGLTLAEAARPLGVPASTASSRYQRARRELRAALDLDGAERHPSPPLPHWQQSFQ